MQNGKLNILFVPTQSAGITYWRMWSFANAAQRCGHSNMKVIWWDKELTETHPWETALEEASSMARVLCELEDWVREADAIVMGMVHTMQALDVFMSIKERAKKLGRNLPVLVELDDNYISTPTYNPASPFYAPNEPLRQITTEQLRQADGLIVSTPHLEEVYSEFNDRIYVIPNCIDVSRWGKTRRGSKPGIRIGWAGGANHDRDLAFMPEVIEAITAKHPAVRFVFVHGVPEYLKHLRNVEVVRKFERIDKYPQFLADLDFDIGLAPLEDNSFNRGKSNLRWLEYSALGIPTVASNVGHFAKTLRHGQDAMLADNPKEFIAHLETLITDKSRRRELGQAAYRRIVADFNVDTISKTYTDVLEAVINLGPREFAVPDFSSPVFAAGYLPEA